MTDRRRRGTGTIERVGPRWRFRCPDGAGGRFTSEAFDGEQEARDALVAFRQRVAARELVPVAGQTLAEYVEQHWLPRMERRRPRSVKTYRSYWSSQISRAPFARRPLRAIARRDVRDWAERLTLAHPQHVLATLHHILRDAVEDELIAANPAQGLRLERPASSEDAARAPTPEEQAALLGCPAIPSRVRSIVAFALGTGLRPGEWRNLELRDVHADGPQPHVVVRFGSAGGPTKGKRIRTVPLFGLALDAVRAWLPRLATEPNPHGLLFPRPDGEHYRQTRPFGERVTDRATDERADVWCDYLAAAGIERRLRLHDLRHGCATDLLAGVRDGRRWSHYEVKALLGHASVTTTERYAHPDAALLFRAARESVQDSPGPKMPPAQITAVSQAIMEGQRSSAQSSHSLSRPGAGMAQNASAAENRAAWTDAGLISDAEAVAADALRGDWPTADEIKALAARVDAAHAAADPVRRAVARVMRGGPGVRAALVALLDLLLPDAGVSLPRRRGAK